MQFAIFGHREWCFESSQNCTSLNALLKPFHSQKFKVQNWRKKPWISFCKIVKSKQHYLRVLLNGFHLNGHTGFHPQTQKVQPNLLTGSERVKANGCELFMLVFFNFWVHFSFICSFLRGVHSRLCTFPRGIFIFRFFFKLFNNILSRQSKPARAPRRFHSNFRIALYNSVLHSMHS